MNRGGQFFLIAAIIIIGVIISLASIVNSVKTTQKQDSFYRLAKEIGFESKRVLDYGVYTASATPQQDLELFLEDYADYIGQEQVLFLFGNQMDITALVYDSSTIGSISIDTGGGTTGVEIQKVTNTLADVTVVGNDVSVVIEGTTYQFTLRQGQNFYFVMIKTEGEERHVAQG